MQYTSQNFSAQPPKLLDQVRAMTFLSITASAPNKLIRTGLGVFILHFGKKHPREMGASEVSQFLTHLAVAGRVSASTQNQARCALLFLYREVLEIELPWLDDVEQAKTPKCLPVVLNRDEVQAILSRLSGTH
ncbi:phage integrase N-terminal SAM-like domain-containing protein [Methylocucumis oryzae]|uniref:phage integrase N-terminal SAM-like domain-containing protein n=1 Tax=Methylocucumis oryzae TaxID=1632867 RepID=UPI000B30E458|nr:phage integrase N-terminal SAM-like domain-containing protein [Methylocucumis oryzae]